MISNFKLVILNALIDDIKYANDSGCSQQVLTDVAEICLKLGRKKLCLTIFQVMRNKNTEIRSHYYWPLLVRVYHNKREAEIYSLVKSMIKEGIEIDFDMLLHYILPYVNTANPIITLQKLLLNNVSSSVICTPLFSFLLQQRRLQDIIPLCKYHIRYKVHYKELMKPLVQVYLASKNVKTYLMLLMAFP